MFNKNITDDVLKDYMTDGSDFGFSVVNSNELNSILSPVGDSEEITAIKEKLDQILELNSSCDGALAVKAQYDVLLNARLLEIEKNLMNETLRIPNVTHPDSPVGSEDQANVIKVVGEKRIKYYFIFSNF